jgi:hypothetical protein
MPSAAGGRRAADAASAPATGGYIHRDPVGVTEVGSQDVSTADTQREADDG